MIINPDGTFQLFKNEQIPFICPRCKWPTEYDDKIVLVMCNHCGMSDFRDKFTADVYMRDVK